MAEESLIQTWRNHEREFRIFADRFSKRGFRPDEFLTNIHGKTGVPAQGLARLRNEADCLRFISANTTTPVPKVLEAYEENGSFTLVTELITGRDIKDLEPADQALVMEEAESYVVVLRSLRSNRPGGPTRTMCPLPRILLRFPATSAKGDLIFIDRVSEAAQSVIWPLSRLANRTPLARFNGPGHAILDRAE